jgi:hypothetical protein
VGDLEFKMIALSNWLSRNKLAGDVVTIELLNAGARSLGLSQEKHAIERYISALEGYAVLERTEENGRIIKQKKSIPAYIFHEVNELW